MSRTSTELDGLICIRFECPVQQIQVSSFKFWSSTIFKSKYIWNDFIAVWEMPLSVHVSFLPAGTGM